MNVQRGWVTPIAAGLEPSSDGQSLGELTGPDLRRQVEVLGAVSGRTQ